MRHAHQQAPRHLTVLQLGPLASRQYRAARSTWPRECGCSLADTTLRKRKMVSPYVACRATCPAQRHRQSRQLRSAGVPYYGRSATHSDGNSPLPSSESVVRLEIVDIVLSLDFSFIAPSLALAVALIHVHIFDLLHCIFVVLFRRLTRVTVHTVIASVMIRLTKR